MNETIEQPQQQQQQQKPATIYPIGHKLIVMAEKNAFSMTRELAVKSYKDIIDGLHFVELEIIAERTVKGDYRPEKEHCGYRAKGSDGWHYNSQWEHFDDTSMQPYQNWQREFIEGQHYTKTGSTFNWSIPKDEFTEHYLNWDVTTMLGNVPPVLTKLFVEHLNQQFPDTQVDVCHASTDNGSGKVFAHDESPRIYYKKRGCFLCNHFNGPNKGNGVQA